MRSKTVWEMCSDFWASYLLTYYRCSEYFEYGVEYSTSYWAVKSLNGTAQSALSVVACAECCMYVLYYVYSVWQLAAISCHYCMLLATWSCRSIYFSMTWLIKTYISRTSDPIERLLPGVVHGSIFHDLTQPNPSQVEKCGPNPIQPNFRLTISI